MKHRVSLVVAFACAFCFALGLAGCSQAGSYEGKTLTPTISSPTIGQNGTLRVGIDADVARRLSRLLRVPAMRASTLIWRRRSPISWA